jgi:ElaA protein
MTISWTTLPFDALPPLILYDVLRLRAEVFVVEQNCAYQDVDRRDVQAFHLMGYNDQGELVAYARLFDAGQCYEQASIGRVVVAPAYRRYGLGQALMQQAIMRISGLFGAQPIQIGAQLYLMRFYEGFGFGQLGEPYDEDGIPHIHMLRP